MELPDVEGVFDRAAGGKIRVTEPSEESVCVLELDNKACPFPELGGEIQTDSLEQKLIVAPRLVTLDREAVVALVARSHFPAKIEGHGPGPHRLDMRPELVLAALRL
jgi:hypothetical protein